MSLSHILPVLLVYLRMLSVCQTIQCIVRFFLLVTRHAQYFPWSYYGVPCLHTCMPSCLAFWYETWSGQEMPSFLHPTFIIETVHTCNTTCYGPGRMTGPLLDTGLDGSGFELRWGRIISVRPPVCLSVCRKEQSEPHWLCFCEMTYLGFLQKFIAAFQLWLKWLT